MSENSEAVTPQEAFIQGMGEDEPAVIDNEAVDNEEFDSEEPQELVLDHDPSDDDPDEYWLEFAKSKGWSDNSEKVKPGYFTDYKAFVRNHDRIQDSKMSKSEVSKLQKAIEETARQTGELTRMQQQRHEQEVATLKQQLEQRKEAAKSSLDFDDYEEADSQLKKLETTTATTTSEQEPTEPPIFVSFREDNPELKHGADTFDEELNTLVESKVNNALRSGEIKSEYQLVKFMEKAVESSKSGLARYQQKPTRTAPPTNRANKSVTIKPTPDKLNPDARKFYDHFKSIGLDGAAEEFLNSTLGA
jgi:hypothetical protein